MCVREREREREKVFLQPLFVNSTLPVFDLFLPTLALTMPTTNKALGFEAVVVHLRLGTPGQGILV